MKNDYERKMEAAEHIAAIILGLSIALGIGVVAVTYARAHSSNYEACMASKANSETACTEPK